MKKVNLKVQMLATLFLPSGAYAFYRINKATKGSIIYIITGILSIGSSIVSLTSYNTPYYWDGVLGITSRYTSDTFSHLLLLIITLVCSSSSIILPMYYIRKWSKEYNSKI